MFRVYINHPWKKAVIHCNECGSCNRGHGVHSGKGDHNSFWIPDAQHRALTAVQANVIAEASGYQVSRCGHCF